MMKSTKDVASRMIETDVMEILMALTKSDTVENKKIKELAAKALEAAAEWKLIRKSENEEQVPQNTNNLENIE